MNTIRLLCVDDNEAILWALGMHFAHTPDFEVVGTRSSAAGLLATIKQLQPDVLVLDLDMPGKSPLQALREIHRSGLLTRTIIFSGYLRKELIDEVMEAGAWGYVTKSDGEAALVEAIRAVMTGEVAWSPEVQSLIGHG